MGHAMIHLNSSLMCAVDIFTTGNKFDHDSLIGIGILPLDNFLDIYRDKDPRRKIIPFEIEIIPKRKENIRCYDPEYNKNLPYQISRKRIMDASINGIEAYMAADLLEKWFEDLKLKHNKNIVPLSYNWAYKIHWLIDWLGFETYHHIFDYRYRDILTFSVGMNDQSNFKAHPIQYPKHDVGYLASELKLQYKANQSLLENCLCISEIYKRMLLS